MPNAGVAMNSLLIEADLLTWMAVHGNLLLALRHPENTGESRQIVERFVEALGKRLIEGGIISQAELELTKAVEGVQ
jgi:hypothetical protein